MAKFTLALAELMTTLTEQGCTVSGTCAIYADVPSTCPLCGIQVPPKTMHTCRKADPLPPAPRSKRKRASRRKDLEQL
jgi:hypothetical protein